MSHKPTCQRMTPSNSQTTIIHMSITCCFMCSCAPTDHMLGGAHTFWSTFNTYDPNSTLVIQLQYLWFMMWCNKQTHGVVRMSRFGIKDAWVAKIFFFTDAHGDVAGEWFLGPELQLKGWTSCSYESNAYLGVWHSSKHIDLDLHVWCNRSCQSIIKHSQIMY